MKQLLEPENAGDDDAIPLYDYTFSAASNGPPPQGTPSHVRASAHVPSSARDYWCRFRPSPFGSQRIV